MRWSKLALFALGLAEDYFGNYRRSLKWVMSLGGMDFDREKSWNYVSTRLVKKGLVVEIGEDMSLLEQGRKEIFKQFPLLEWRKKPWDGKWRVLMYDMPEKMRGKRNLLRRFLKKLGMGQWQLSVWVSPHPVVNNLSEIVEAVGLGDYCSVHESRLVVGIADKEFANKIWGLDSLNEKYKKMESGLAKANRSLVFDQLMADPFMPKELLPDGWRWNMLMEKLIFLK